MTLWTFLDRNMLWLVVLGIALFASWSDIAKSCGGQRYEANGCRLELRAATSDAGAL